MNTRLFIRRYSEFNSEEKTLKTNIIKDLNLDKSFKIKVYHCFDIKDGKEKDIASLEYYIKQNKTLMVRNNIKNKALHVMPHEGQTDFVLNYFKMIASAMNIELTINHSIIYEFKMDENFERIKTYLVNPNEFVDFTETTNDSILDKHLETYNLKGLNEQELLELSHLSGLDLLDLRMVKDYCVQKNRDVNELELKFLSTYWSDHCRHTTFNTELEDISFSGPYQSLLESTYEEYLELKNNIRPNKPVTLMELAQINARNLKHKGQLGDVEDSKEVNAASISVMIEDEEYLLMLKNETHNHPTELEPYGGASTCIGGCVRDPMSNRGTVFQGMRITGSKSPLTAFDDRLPGKLSSKQICQKSAQGFADYANQMGLRTDYVKEYYHDGFEAKRMELGAVLASSLRRDVIKKEPVVGDLILVLGGKTGRDGIGAAVGSSSANSDEKPQLKGAEVQKGNPIVERKLMRLFADGRFTRLVKRSNDFGAGGLSVALGELSDGIDIQLKNMNLKYPLTPLEIALSESQERMAIVIDPNDKDQIKSLAETLDIDVRSVGCVTDTQQFRMYYGDECVLNFDRQFLNENGAKRKQSVHVSTQKIKINRDPLNKENQEGLRSMFANGNMSHLYESESMSMPIPNLNGSNEVYSILSCGYNPWLGSVSPYHAGYESVIEAVSKVVASGGSDENIRLSFQEFFPAPHQDKQRWGLVFSAMLGAFKAMNDLNLPSIGGKDSMCGSYETLDVPPSILCFAMQTKHHSMDIHNQLTQEGNTLVLIKTPYTYEGLLEIKEYKKINEQVLNLIRSKDIKSIATINHTLQETIENMGINNRLTVKYQQGLNEMIPVGSYLIEVSNLSCLTDLKGEVLGTIVKDESLIIPSRLHSVYPNESYLNRSATQTSTPNLSGKKALVVVFDGFVEDMNLTNALIHRNLEVSHYYVRNFNQDLLDLSLEIFNYDFVFMGDGYNELNPIFDGGEILELVFRNKAIRKSLMQFNGHKPTLITSGSSTIALIKADYFNTGTLIHSKDTLKSSSLLISATHDYGVKNVRLNGHYTYVENVQSKYIYSKSLEPINDVYRPIDFKHDKLNIFASLAIMDDENLDDILNRLMKERQA